MSVESCNQDVKKTIIFDTLHLVIDESPKYCLDKIKPIFNNLVKNYRYFINSIDTCIKLI